MLRFPSAFETPREIAEALRHMAVWSEARRNVVWIPQFASVKRFVREISRTPSGSRIKNLYREVNLWPEDTEVAASLSPGGAAGLFLAAQEESDALLELGYARNDGIDFVTRLPCPGLNTVRTRNEIRAAVHHLGGDPELMLQLIRKPDRFHPSLKICFSVWPHPLLHIPGMLPDNSFSLHLHFPGQLVPAVITMNRTLLGYCLLSVFDLSSRLKRVIGVKRTVEDFAIFADSFVRSSDRE